MLTSLPKQLRKGAWHFLVPKTWCNRQQSTLNYCRNLIAMSRRMYKGQSAQAKASCGTNLMVLLDLDQVLADFEGYFLKKYKETFPDLPFIPEDERNTFYLRDQYAKLRSDLPAYEGLLEICLIRTHFQCDLHTTTSDKVREVYCQELFFLNLPEIKGSIEAAKEMAEMENVDVFICTSPLTYYRHCLHEKFQWVEEHLGEDWVDRIIIAKDKTMVNGHILIDDRPYVKGACKKPSWEHIVFTANHNTTTDIRGKRRLDSWTDGQWRDIIEDFKKRI